MAVASSSTCLIIHDNISLPLTIATLHLLLVLKSKVTSLHHTLKHVHWHGYVCVCLCVCCSVTAATWEGVFSEIPTVLTSPNHSVWATPVPPVQRRHHSLHHITLCVRQLECVCVCVGMRACVRICVCVCETKGIAGGRGKSGVSTCGGFHPSGQGPQFADKAQCREDSGQLACC